MQDTEQITLTDAEQAELDRNVTERGERFAEAYWSARRYDHSHEASIDGARWATA